MSNRPTLFTTYRRLAPSQRRDVWRSFAILFSALAAHTILETARDALFLAGLPASSLPIAYLAVAVATALATRITGERSPGRSLGYTFVLGALGTMGFWWWLGRDGSQATLVALYVWPGVVTTTLAVQFWLRLHRRLDIEQAKALYGAIAAGASVGALAGAGLATVTSDWLGAHALLPVAAIGHGVGALLAFWEGKTPPPLPSDEPEPIDEDEPAWRDGYVVGLVALAAIVSVGATLVDYLFKAIIDERVAAEGLASLLARFHVVVNASAIVAQLVVLPRLLQSVQIRQVLLVLPLTLLSGGMILALAAGLGTVLALQGATMVLKHSIHGTTVEMLFLPLRGRRRARAKAWFASYGKRGGQAVTSAAILLVVGQPWSQRALAVAVVVLGLCAVALVLRLHHGYLERFRDRLRERFVEPGPIEPPPLDVASLESLVEALSSPNDQEVLAALDLLHLYDEDALIPPLVLHHRSERVVLRALTLLARSRQEGVEPMLEALLERPEATIRAAALRAACAFGPASARRAREALEGDDSVEVAVARQLAGYTAEAWETGAARDTVGDLAKGSRSQRLALAAGVFLVPADIRGGVVKTLLQGKDEAIRDALARALALFPEADDLPCLIRLLEHDETRETVRRAIARLDPDRALEALRRHFDDPETRLGVRRHVPRTVSRFPAERVSELLSRWLGEEQDDRITLKLLRGLGRIRDRHPGTPIDEEVVRDKLRTTVASARSLLLRRDLIHEATKREPALDIPASVLLISLLEERVRHAIERAFRLLHLIYPRSELSVIHACSFDRDPAVRAASREILRHLVARELTIEIVALVEGRGALEEGDHARSWQTLAQLFGEQAGEVGGERLVDVYREALQQLADGPDDVVAQVAKVCLRALDEPRPDVERDPRFEGVVSRLGLDSGDRLLPAEPPEPLRVIE